jgi:hypothetical protein
MTNLAREYCNLVKRRVGLRDARLVRLHDFSSNVTVDPALPVPCARGIGGDPRKRDGGLHKRRSKRR